MIQAPSVEDLSRARTIDLAAVDLDYEGFRALARNPNLSLNEKIGFPESYRQSFDASILADITTKLTVLVEAQGRTLIDIGPGCSSLPRALIALCQARAHTIVLVDSPEMLALLPDLPGVVRKCPGLFPDNEGEVRRMAGGPADAILCYSVMHYVHAHGDSGALVERVAGLLAPQGRALIGDIPNESKRRRFFSSERGQAFHRAFTGRNDAYVVPTGEIAASKISDVVLSRLIQRAQAAGCDAYLTPQSPDLPMANRSDDLLIARP